MQIAILGPLEVRDAEGRPVAVSGGRLRALLARLALDAGRPVRPDALVDAVWGERPPADSANALQTLVSRLRRLLGAAAIVQSAAGYRLALDPDALDAARFEALAASGAAALGRGEHRTARDELTGALALWRAAPFADVEDPAGTLDAAGRRLSDVRLRAHVDLAAAQLALGTADAAPLAALVAEHPLHEPLTAALMRALAATSRQADALHAFERLRERLADELGVDPSPEVQQLHLDLLRGELTAPEPAAPPARRTNLKAQLTSFVGRDAEVTRIAKSLEEGRLVTLVGPGGAGKTRLAAESARRILDAAPDGVWLAELAAVTAGADVAQAVLGSVGLREVHMMDRAGPLAPRDAVARLADALADKAAVLVLDNCEHVIDASARLAEQLLGDCPELRVLATSREPLGILGETLLVVPPLGQPEPAASAAEALEYPAVRLFADRAAAARPDFAVDQQTVGAVVEIVRRLDGLPLAIELAAARLRTMPVEDIAARLSDRFRLLTGGSRTALPRHRTLRAVVAWSWELLTDDERRLAALLSVFPAGMTADSAAAVRPADIEAYEVSDLLASLVDKSLLQAVGGGRRFRMLETIREFAGEQLAERGLLGRAREMHAAYFRGLLADAVPHLTTAGQLPYFALLRDEQENVIAALRYYCDVSDADAALTIAVDLSWFSMMLGGHGESADWLAEALAVPGGTDEFLRLIARASLAINRAGGDSASAEDLDPALRGLRELAFELAEAPVPSRPLATVMRAAVAFFAGEEDLSRRLIEETTANGDPWSRAAAWMFSASLAENSGDVAGMRVGVERALVGFRELGERWGLASTLRTLAALRTLDGDLDGAAEAYAEALNAMRELESDDDQVLMLGQLVDLALRRGDLDEARRQAELARDAADLQGGGIEAVFTATLLATTEYRIGNSARAHELIASAEVRLAALPREHPVRGHVRAIMNATGARLALHEGDDAGAAVRAGEAYEAAVGTNDLPVVANVGVAVAELSLAAGESAIAAAQLGAAARLRGADDPTDADIAAATARARAELGDEAFDAAYEGGRALSRADAIARLNPCP